MQLTLRQQLMQFGHTLQQELFPVLEDVVGPLTPSAQLLVAILNMAPLKRFIPVSQGWNGRPAKDRYAIACAMAAKAVYNLPTTSKLLERLAEDEQLRLAICPSGATRIHLLASLCRVRAPADAANGAGSTRTGNPKRSTPWPHRTRFHSDSRTRALSGNQA